jgi:hypothetical protein
MKRTLYLLIAAGLTVTVACGKSASDQLAQQKLTAIHEACDAKVTAALGTDHANDPSFAAVRKFIYDRDMKECTVKRLAQ